KNQMVFSNSIQSNLSQYSTAYIACQLFIRQHEKQTHPFQPIPALKQQDGRYELSILSWEMLGQLKYLPQLKTDFSLRLDDNKKPVLYFKQQKVTEVDFIEPSGFYRQST